MARIFLSYQKRDRPLAERIDKALTDAGHSIWWDDDVTPRENWDRTIEREIAAADFVVALWTPNSVTSDWVRIEANYARTCVPSKLVQARFEGAPIPIAFSLTQYVDLDQKSPQRSVSWPKLLTWLEDPAALAATGTSVTPQADERTTPDPPRRAEEMEIARPGAMPIWFKALSSVFLVWNLLGSISAIAAWLEPPMVDSTIDFGFAQIPPWVFLGEAIGASAGVIGNAGLVLRKRWAIHVLIVAFAALMGAQLGIASVFGLASAIMAVSIAAIPLALASFANKKGWLS